MHCWARYLFIAVVFVLGIGQMIAACGQKGDLYLPDPEKETRETKATTAETGGTPQAQTGEQPTGDEKTADIPKAPHPAAPAAANQ